MTGKISKNDDYPKFFDNFKPFDELFIYPLLKKSNIIKNFLNYKSDESFLISMLCAIAIYYFTYKSNIDACNILLFLFFLSNIIDKSFYYKYSKNTDNIKIINQYKLLIIKLIIYNIIFLVYYKKNIYTSNILYLYLLIQIVLLLISHNIYIVIKDCNDIDKNIIKNIISISLTIIIIITFYILKNKNLFNDFIKLF
jgi:hypothetical protein